MTEKELQKLRRQDLLELMLAQGQQMVELQGTLDTTTEELEAIRETDERLKEKLNEKDAQMESTSERLKEKLNEKDALIEKLKGRLDQKDAKIRELEKTMQDQQESRRIELEEAGSIAMAALRLNAVFDAAQQAVEQYLYNVRELCREKYGDLADLAEMPDVQPKLYIEVDPNEPEPDEDAEENGEAVPEELFAEPELVEAPEPVKEPKRVKEPEPVEEWEPVEEAAPVAKPKTAAKPKYGAAPAAKLPAMPSKTEIFAKMGKGVGAFADYLNRISREE